MNGRLKDKIRNLLFGNIPNSKSSLAQAIQAIEEGASVHQIAIKIESYWGFFQTLVASMHNHKITKLIGLSEKDSVLISEYEVVDRLLRRWVLSYASKSIKNIINGKIIIILLLSSFLRFLHGSFIKNIIFNENINSKNQVEIQYMKKAYQLRKYYLRNNQSKS